jgi:hypothetical protein
MKSPMLFKIIFCLATLSASVTPQQKSTFKPDLSHSANISAWFLDGSGSWSILEGKLVLSKAGVPSGPIRRPAALAILKTSPFRLVTLEADIRCTAPLDVIRRDLDVIVAYDSPTRFYYVHLSATSDSVHNGIFLVNNANRVRIDGGKGKPQLMDSTWHHVRVERDGSTGRIEVFMNRSKNPVLQAMDATICCGRAGFGSFDDTGEFRNILIRGAKSE